MAAEAAVSSVVEILGNLLIETVKFLGGVNGDVQWLKGELKRMQSFLTDATEKQAKEKGEYVRNWISDIRKVAYDAQDAIEIFILKVENARRSRGPLGRCASFPNHWYQLNKVGKKIKSIRQRLKDIESGLKTYNIQGLGEGVESTMRSENVERRRRLPTWKDDEDVVGLEEDTKLLLQEAILEETKGLSIAAIVGMGGIGKSTLATKIYNHSAVAARFTCRAWVVVSSQFTPEDVIKQIILRISKDEGDKLKGVESVTDKLGREAMLQEMLYQHLVGKQYFIVLDDVWEHTHWESLKSAFPDEQDKTSKLLFTSRNNDIKKYARYVREMEPLDHNKSWELFLKKSFKENTDRECPEGLEKIGRKILEECHGLPLAICVVGGLLVEQPKSESGWEKVLSGINSNLGRDEYEVSTILELSYQNLSPQLKSCFLCLAFFKEDATIVAKSLVHIWVAQGFVHQEGEESMEERAQSYLDELINRNLIQVKNISIDGRAKRCKVHDFIRELSIRKAKEEICFETLREEGSSSELSCEPRHCAVHYSQERFLINSLNQNENLRSLFLHVDRHYEYVDDVGRPSYWKSFELLKILDMEGIMIRKFPDMIRALIGLKYLRIRAVDILKLPIWLNRLKNLEVLDIAGRDVHLPDVKLEMDSLRHFYAAKIIGPMNIDTWKNLQTLKYISSDIDLMLHHPREMANCRVRKLGIVVHHGSRPSCLFDSLEKMKNLAQLHVRWNDTLEPRIFSIPLPDHITKLKLDGSMNQFVAANILPQNLSHLTLLSTRIMDEDLMAKLGKLPNLLYLKLHDDAYVGMKMEVPPNGFPRLEVLSLRRIHFLRHMNIGEGGMPQLQRLEIYNCSSLKIENLRECLSLAAITFSGYSI